MLLSLVYHIAEYLAARLLDTLVLCFEIEGWTIQGLDTDKQSLAKYNILLFKIHNEEF